MTSGAAGGVSSRSPGEPGDPDRLRILTIVGTRPNFVKVASLMEAYRSKGAGVIDPVLVHTGQHYDDAMSDNFFRDMDLSRPDVNLNVGSGSHAAQTAQIMTRFEQVVVDQQPSAVVVVGDVNSTVACALVCAKMRVPVVHVEAGLRSGDRLMPEEINRLVTDAVADLMFCTEPAAVRNLAREGADPDNVFLVGNVMVDTLLRFRERARSSRVLEELGVTPGNYAVVTLHRPSNVDDGAVLAGLAEAITQVLSTVPVVLPAHPRLRNALAQAGLEAWSDRSRDLKMTGPLPYLDFVELLANARVALTDSGGVQEETTVLGVPCVTLRNNTERPITIEAGTNRLAGVEPQSVVAAFRAALRDGDADGDQDRARRLGQERPPASDGDREGLKHDRPLPPLWDGKAAERIVPILVERLRAQRSMTRAPI